MLGHPGARRRVKIETPNRYRDEQRNLPPMHTGDHISTVSEWSLELCLSSLDRLQSHVFGKVAGLEPANASNLSITSLHKDFGSCEIMFPSGVDFANQAAAKMVPKSEDIGLAYQVIRLQSVRLVHLGSRVNKRHLPAR